MKGKITSIAFVFLFCSTGFICAQDHTSSQNRFAKGFHIGVGMRYHL